jgi:MtaA/CmuA family methyltransferase
MGLNQVLIATIENPMQLHKAIEKRLPLTYRWIEEMVEFNPACIWIGEGFASSSLISPKCYREFVLPYEQAVADKIHQYGIPCLLHICGKTEPIIEIVPETGVDCMEVDWQVDIVKAKACIGNKIALKGNLNTTSLVLAGPEEIYKQSLVLIQEVSAGGGYILSSGCALGRDTPPENVDAMVQAVLDQGFYNL